MKKELFTLIFTILPMALWADAVEVDGISYTLNSNPNEAEVTARVGKYSGDIVIPDSIEYDNTVYKVTSIGNRSFSECTDLTSVVIGHNVNHIGTFAFNGCTGLTSFTIPENIRNVEQYFLSGCTSLETIVFNCDTIKDWVGSVIGKQISKVTLGKNVKVIGEQAFKGFKSLKTIEISNGLKKIEKLAFQYCNIGTVCINDLKSWCEIECIGGYSHPFYYNYTYGKSLILNGDTISDLILDDNITSIGKYAFACTNIKSVTFNNKLTHICATAFEYCEYLSSVYVQDLKTWLNITFDGPSANPLSNGAHFYVNQIEESNLIIPDNVKRINDYAFAGWKECLSTTIPNEVTTIGNGAFYNCENLKEINLNEGLLSIGDYAFSGCEKLRSISIPSSVYSIGANSFEKCKQLYSIRIPDNVSSIEASTFSLCDNLKDVHLGRGVATIGGSAFFRCALNSIDIPDNVTTIASGAFNNCFTLHYVVLGKGIKEIGENAFSYCNIYGLFCYSDTIPTAHEYTFRKAEIGTLYVPDNLIEDFKQKVAWRDFGNFNTLPKITYIIDDEAYKSYIIKYGETIVPEEFPTKDGYTFSGWSDIPEIMPAYDVVVTGSFTANTPNKYVLTYMVDGEVYKAYELEEGTTITPEDEPTKEGYTFSGWSEIPETMPAKDVIVTGTFSINKYKLVYKVDGEEYKSYDVEYGATITPEAEPTKEGYTFSGWSEIPATMPANDVTVTGSFTQIDYVIGDATYEVSGDEVSVIKGNNYSGDVEISSTIVINDKTYTVTSIADGAFKDNTNITSVTIPESVTAIGANAFDGCSGLTSINIGKSVTSIGSKAFANLTPVAKTRGDGGLKINCYATSVPTTAADAFENTSISNATLLVDDNSVDAYKATAPWSGFGTIMGFNEAAGIDGVLLDNVSKAKIFSIDGTPLNKPQKGINIIRMDNGKTKKVVAK